jgi:MerR family transcriptional regulator, heat shock protein HspR
MSAIGRQCVRSLPRTAPVVEITERISTHQHHLHLLNSMIYVSRYRLCTPKRLGLAREKWWQVGNLVRDESADRSARGVYSISVAAELSGVGEQSLRQYEQRGLLTPARSAGGTRRYSNDDIARLHRITELLAGGVNVAGISQILDLQDRNARLESDNAALKAAALKSPR